MVSVRTGQTESMRDDVSRAGDIDDMREILHKYSNSYISWKRFINDILAFYSYKVSQLSAACGFSRNTIKKWRDNGDMPHSRKEFIKLGFGIGMSLEDINDLLQRYGKYPKLYAKNIEDALYIYGLTHDKTFAETESLAKKLLAYFDVLSERPQAADISDPESTQGFQARIAQLNKEDDLLGFIDEHKAVFDSVYERLTAYIDMFINERTINYTGTDESLSLNSLLGGKIENPLVVGYFNDMVSALRTRKVIPNRLRLVALGVHLEMTVDELDKLLELANMERLCPKDKVECAVIYAIESLLLNDPDDLVGGLLERLEADSQTKNRCLSIMDKYRRTEEETENDYSQSDLAAYLADTLKTLDIEDAQALLALLR